MYLIEEAKARKAEEKHTHKDGIFKSIFSGKRSSHAAAPATTTSDEHEQADAKAVAAPATTAISPTTSTANNKENADNSSAGAPIVPSTETTIVAQSSPEAAKDNKSTPATSPIREQLPKTEPTKSSESAKAEPKVLNVLFNRLKRKQKQEEPSKATAAAPAPAAAVVAAEMGDGSTVAAAAAVVKEGEGEEKGTTAIAAISETTSRAEDGNKTPSAVEAAAASSPVDQTSGTPMSTLASEDASTTAIISSHRPSPPTSPSGRPARTSISSVSSLSETDSRLAAALANEPSHPASAENNKAPATDDKVVEPTESGEGEEKRSRFAKTVAGSREKDSDNEFEDARETKDPNASVPKATPAAAAAAAAPTSAPAVTDTAVHEDGAEDKLAPPSATFASRTKSESPARDSKFQEQL